LGRKVFFTGCIRSLHFARVIRSASRRSDPFSHPSGSSARSGGSALLFLKSRLSPLFRPLRPTRFSESRKRSVPGRVHAIYKIGGSWAARGGPVQPLVDSRHGRIASKVISPAFGVAGERESGRIQSNQRALGQPLALACPRSP